VLYLLFFLNNLLILKQTVVKDPESRRAIYIRQHIIEIVLSCSIFPMRAILRTYIVELLKRGSWALFHPVTETLRADSRAVLCCPEGLKGGWLLLKSDSPLQSPDTNGVNNHYVVRWGNPVVETSAVEPLISMHLFAVAKCSAWIVLIEILRHLSSKPSYTKICYSVAPHPPVSPYNQQTHTHTRVT
jgi:hypothetical protein